jgi:hypothetical protein
MAGRQFGPALRSPVYWRITRGVPVRWASDNLVQFVRSL